MGQLLGEAEHGGLGKNLLGRNWLGRYFIFENICFPKRAGIVPNLKEWIFDETFPVNRNDKADGTSNLAGINPICRGNKRLDSVKNEAAQGAEVCRQSGLIQ